MTVRDRIRDLGVERARSWLAQEPEASFIDQQAHAWSAWLALPTARLQRVLERAEIGRDLERVVEYVLQHPQAVLQTLALLDHLDELADTFEIQIDELILGTEADGTSQLELYARMRGSLEDVYSVRESIERLLDSRFPAQPRFVAVVVLRRK
jgi:hypothetical protein